MAVAVVATFGLASCGGADVDEMAEEFCACAEADDVEKCVTEWEEKYEDATGGEDAAKELKEKTSECLDKVTEAMMKQKLGE